MSNKAIGGILLIAGTCIGAGTLIMPISTADLGLLPTLALIATCWVFMTFSALYLLEASMQFPASTNMISMTEQTLGPIAKGAAWFMYLFLCYAVCAAYIDGTGQAIKSQ
ncbi:MAG: aromatic amino acid transport family protein, partial [Pseudomonadota bacterium]